jgi:hypothetical protein
MRFRLRGAVQQVAGPMRMVTVPARADGDQTSKVTQAGPVMRKVMENARGAADLVGCWHLGGHRLRRSDQVVLILGVVVLADGDRLGTSCRERAGSRVPVRGPGTARH